eukprot:84934-Lingulodinium_polyedra.AAC.1
MHPRADDVGAPSARRLLIAVECQRRRLDVVGLQETRVRRDMCSQQAGYTMVAAAAEPGGAGGVECWISTRGDAEPSD